jgi:hypothetical protein
MTRVCRRRFPALGRPAARRSKLWATRTFRAWSVVAPTALRLAPGELAATLTFRSRRVGGAAPDSTWIEERGEACASMGGQTGARRGPNRAGRHPARLESSSSRGIRAAGAGWCSCRTPLAVSTTHAIATEPIAIAFAGEVRRRSRPSCATARGVPRTVAVGTVGGMTKLRENGSRSGGHTCSTGRAGGLDPNAACHPHEGA